MTHYADGNEARPGDWVTCISSQYSSIREGERRQVIRVEEDNIVMKNRDCLHGTSPYRSRNFVLINRAQPKQEKNSMFHIAVQCADKAYAPTYSELVEAINHGGTGFPMMIADTSGDALKEKVRVRIEKNPSERWVLLSGHTLGELAAPPVRFRSL